MTIPGEQVERIALVQEEPVDARRRIIDAHHHLWGEGQGLGGSPAYLQENLLADMAGHNVVGTVYVECGVSFRSDGPEHLRPVGETAFAASEASKSAGARAPILGIVANADLALGGVVQEVLDAHAEAGNGLFRGIRQLPGGGGRAPRDLLSETAFRDVDPAGATCGVRSQCSGHPVDSQPPRHAGVPPG
jgi:predicted TIM-barrel fold metal-dependent hydrolase